MEYNIDDLEDEDWFPKLSAEQISFYEKAFARYKAFKGTDSNLFDGELLRKLYDKFLNETTRYQDSDDAKLFLEFLLKQKK